jgi:metallo-beta-lactamase class B
VLRDSEVIELGDIKITAFLTPGHTKGSTTYVTDITADGKTYNVVFPDGTSVNPGYRVARNPSYPGIEGNYRRTMQVLEVLKPDVWLTCHTEVFGFDRKRARVAREGDAAWLDPEGYKKQIAAVKTRFDAALAKESVAPIGEQK